jgi:hypothetical protein
MNRLECPFDFDGAIASSSFRKTNPPTVIFLQVAEGLPLSPTYMSERSTLLRL